MSSMIQKYKHYRNDSAVSPVVGVVLMIAITVVMAGIVSSWSTGIKTPSTPTTIGLDIARSGTDVSIVIISIDPISSAPLPYVNVTYANSSNVMETISFSNVDVGDSMEITTYSTTSRVIITAAYKDGSKKVLYSQEV